jgi:hypothetical protein
LLDQPATVASWLQANAVASLYSDSGSPGPAPSLRKGTPINHKQQIVGLPEPLCAENLWNPVPSQSMNGQGLLAIVGHDFKAGSQTTLPVCVLEIRYKPDDSLFSGQGLKTARLDYVLENVFADQKLRLTTQKVTYQTSDLPKLSSLQSFPYPFTPDSKLNGSVLTWNIGVEAFQSPDQPLDFSKKPQSLGDLSISGCKVLANAKDPVISNIVPTDMPSA